MSPGCTEPIYPVYVVADDPANLTFYVSADVATAIPIAADADPVRFERFRAA